VEIGRITVAWVEVVTNVLKVLALEEGAEERGVRHGGSRVLSP
jgi:hypothetical protein